MSRYQSQSQTAITDEPKMTLSIDEIKRFEDILIVSIKLAIIALIIINPNHTRVMINIKFSVTLLKS